LIRNGRQDFLKIFFPFKAFFEKHSSAMFKKNNDERGKKSKKDNFRLQINGP